MRGYLAILAARIAAREPRQRRELDRRNGWLALCLALAGIAAVAVFLMT